MLHNSFPSKRKSIFFVRLYSYDRLAATRALGIVVSIIQSIVAGIVANITARDVVRETSLSFPVLLVNIPRVTNSMPFVEFVKFE